jgi:regulator of sirC expression with transglutaminase-like and TPR domain
MDVTARFVELVNGPPDAIDLATGALLLAAHADPTVDIDAQRGRLDDLAAAVPVADLDGLRRHLFETEGFSGRTDDYYAAENSFLPQVLDSRRGIPITLSVVVIEVGRRVGVPLVGIGMPGHFLVASADMPGRYLDPFHGGTELDDAGCEQRFRSVAGAKAPFHRSYLAPVDAASILGRMASNLVQAYRRADDRLGLRWAVRLRSACPGVGSGELIQLALAQRRTGATDEAAALIDRALPGLPPDDADRWRREAHRMRAALN